MHRVNWHRLFGLLLTDYFAGSPYIVELEKDLSIKKQLLDVVIVRKGHGRFRRRLPDGLDNLGSHNLITFKSHRENLDDWSLKELTGHYVNYRKQVSPPSGTLLPEEEFRLYAVSSGYPHNLASTVGLQTLQDGLYECRRGSDVIRVIVLRQIPLAEHNAVLHLLSASPEMVGYAADHYKLQSLDTGTLVGQLFEGFEKEGINVSYTMEDFRRDFTKQNLKELTPEERLRGLSPEERLRGLSPQEIESYLKRIKGNMSSGKRKGKSKE